jgi:hypothetical protein
MFRIVQFRIPTDQFDALIESKPDATRRFYDEAGHGHSTGGFYRSDTMATTDKRFFVAEQYLRSLVGDPPHLVEDVTQEYALYRTRAPKAYDYGYVVEVGRVDGEFGEERLVAIPKQFAEYQSGRYSSGMFTPVKCS